MLRTSSPSDGAMPTSGDGIAVDKLYVPERWLSDPEAGEFLEQAVMLGMQPVSAQKGPFAFYEAGASAVFVRAGCGRYDGDCSLCVCNRLLRRLAVAGGSGYRCGECGGKPR